MRMTQTAAAIAVIVTRFRTPQHILNMVSVPQLPPIDHTKFVFTQDELSLDAVPTELWMEIITFLHSRDLMHLALSNSRWKPVALEVKWKTKRVPLDALLKTLAPVRHTYGTSHVYYAVRQVFIFVRT